MVTSACYLLFTYISFFHFKWLSNCHKSITSFYFINGNTSNFISIKPNKHVYVVGSINIYQNLSN